MRGRSAGVRLLLAYQSPSQVEAAFIHKRTLIYDNTNVQIHLGAPSGYTLQVRDILPSAGAGFVVALAGEIMTMPGLSKTPAAEKIRVDPDGTIEGLF